MTPRSGSPCRCSVCVRGDEYPVPARPGPTGRGSANAQLVALGGLSGGDGDQFRPSVPRPGRVPNGWRAGCPHLPSQSQYNRRLRALTETVDGCAAAARASCSTRAVPGSRTGRSSGSPTTPAVPARSEFTRHRRLRLLRLEERMGSGASGSCCAQTRRGLPARLHARCQPTNTSTSRCSSWSKTGETKEGVITNKGVLGPRLQPEDGVRPRGAAWCSPHTRQHETAANRDREDGALAGLRLTIESVYLEPQRADAARTATSPKRHADSHNGSRNASSRSHLGILLNTLHGRPARALAAYDGR